MALGLAALLVPVVPFVWLGELPGKEWLAEARDPWALGALGAGLLAADVLLPIPSTVVGSALGASLGLIRGALWCWGGLVAGNLAGYALGRLAGRRAGVDLPPVGSALALFVTRPVPVLAEAVAVASGAGRVPLRTFVGASVLGNAVFAAALAASGVALISEAWAGVGLALPLGLPVAGFLLLRRLRSRARRGPGCDPAP